ncbi:antitoxin Xre/MbcA/ParS toxin-binding domain-containing protein [Pseudoxanthomonas broegbernensis]|uniref:antitoxin Xre/MbcA/ParS toxin-binding domain-containing protein n=2 Tax=Pseudoxanthomonas broegbernensis TaxID=83619 RepID=UPI003CCD67FB
MPFAKSCGGWELPSRMWRRPSIGHINNDARAGWLQKPLRAFGYKTADALIQEGRVDAVIAYLESLAGGAAG